MVLGVSYLRVLAQRPTGCCSASILLWQGYVRQLQSIHEGWSWQQNNKTTNRQRFIPVNEITSKIGQDVSICLPASHAISGCDTTTSLFKTCKRTAYNTLVVNIADMLSLAELGQSSDVTNGLPTETKYALLLYGVKGKSCQSLNRLRYNYACRSDTSASLFPPIDDAFEQHIRRVNY